MAFFIRRKLAQLGRRGKRKTTIGAAWPFPVRKFRLTAGAGYAYVTGAVGIGQPVHDVNEFVLGFESNPFLALGASSRR